MKWYEIMIIIISIIFVLFIVGQYIYKRIKHYPTGECAQCHTSIRTFVKKYKKNKLKK